MSALFKLVLGQKVVHPNGAKPKAEPTSQANGDVATADYADDASSHAVAYEAKSATGAPHNGQRIASPAARVAGPSLTDAIGRPAPTAAPSTNRSASSSPKAAPAASPSPAEKIPSSLPNSLRPSAPTRTLLLRIEGCTVAQDIRDALRDLLRCPDLPYALDETSLKSLTALLTNYADDESITEPTLHLLAIATDLEAYPSKLESNRRTIEVTTADKRHTCEGLLQVLVEEVPLLLESVNAAAPFWSRLHAVVLLQRLEEYEPSKVNHALLAARGVGALLDALNETEHDNALRNQALLLLTSLTLADRELQTLLAFDNAFESLFDLIQREGGVLAGGTVVRDSLTVVHNMLRSNKATQKFFREMGCAARLAALFDAIPAELAACTTADQRRGNVSASQSNWPQPAVLSDKLVRLLDRVNNPGVLLNVLMSVSVLACVLRGHEESEEEFHSTQDALLRCGLLHPLTRLAFCGLAIDDATRIEAVRVLALLLDQSKRAMEEWLSAPAMVTLARSTPPYSVRVWPAQRALLSYVCETTDTTLVNAGVQLFLSTLSVPACQERVVGVFMGGLIGNTVSGATAVGNSSAASTLGAAAKATSVGKNGANGALNNGSSSSSSGSSLSDPQCGSALARLLLSPATSAVEKYYTAQVFRTLIGLPAAAKLSESLVRSAVPTELQQGKLDILVKAQPGWTLSSRLTPSFFNYYVSYLLFAISGGAASQQMNTSALGAYVAALLAWTGACPWAAAALVQEVSWCDTLLRQARRDGAAHLRLWSAMLLARGCVVVRAAAAAASSKSTPHLGESATVAAGTALVQRFIEVVGGGVALDTILFDAQASAPAWQHPVPSGLRAPTPTTYDEPFVAQVEQLVQEFKQLLSTAAGTSISSASLPLLPHPAQPASGTAALSSSSSPPPPYAPVTVTPETAPEYTSLPPQEQPQPSQQQSVVVSAPPNFASSADYQVPSSSTLSHTTLPHAMTGDAPAGHAEPNAEALALIQALQAQLHAAEAERVRLMSTVDEWRGRAELSEAQCITLRKEQAERSAALATAQAELARQRDVAAAAQASASSADVVEGLRENIRLLEEALNSKDEEQQQLVESLNMMEEQLRHATDAAAAANEQRATALATLAQQQQQQQQQQGPPPAWIAEVEDERGTLHRRLEEAQQNVGRLSRALQELTKDYHDLLLMVAELNEECVSVKALSSMAPTPARPLPEWPSTNLSANWDYDHGVPAPSTVTGADADQDVQALVNSLPVAAEGMWSATAESPSTQLAELARAASSAAYAAATDVLIDSSPSQPSPPLLVGPPPHHDEHHRHFHEQTSISPPTHQCSFEHHGTLHPVTAALGPQQRQQEAVPAENEKSHHNGTAGTSPLPSADEFFGVDGGNEDESNGNDVFGHAVSTAVTATHSGHSDLPAGAHDRSANPLPSPLASQPQAKPTSASASMKNEHIASDAMPLTPPPPPPMAPSSYKRPVSALAGNSRHLDYKAKTGPNEQRPNPHATAANVNERNGTVTSSARAPPPPPAAPAAALPHDKSSESAPHSVTAYNPFADIQGGDNDNDGLAELR